MDRLEKKKKRSQSRWFEWMFTSELILLMTHSKPCRPLPAFELIRDVIKSSM